MGKMKKRTISTLKAIFGSKKGKRHHSKSSLSVTSEHSGANTPVSDSFRPLPRTPPSGRVGPPPSPPVPTHPVAPVAPEPPGPVRLIPCAVCARTFVPESLSKHVKICEKTAVKKRKTFDSSRQRREGTDLEQFLPKNFGLPENSPFLEKSPPNTAKVAPKPKQQSVRSTIMKPTADLQKCPHCSRAFGLRAFERHVEWCADKAKILPAAPAQPPQHIADAKQRLNARTQYKAPLSRGRRSSQTRDKSSNSRSASVESSRGVSPPPPREYGDVRNRRNRASESMSSNDCHDDASPHVPVIKNGRNSVNNSSGDANVKARQARLARDLSSSRNELKEPKPPIAKQSKIDPNSKKTQNEMKRQMNIKKEQQLKKLEEIAHQYNERQAKAAEEKKKKRLENRQIPVLKKVVTKKVKKDDIASSTEKSDSMSVTYNPVIKPSTSKAKPLKSFETSTQEKKSKDIIIKNKVKKNAMSLLKEKSLSVDSLDDCITVTGNDKNVQTIGINTELLCVPCVIHENVEINPSTCNDKTKLSRVESVQQVSARKGKTSVIDSKLEVLYTNSTIESSCPTQATTSTVSNFSKSDNYLSESSKDTYNVKNNDMTESDNNSCNKLNLSKLKPESYEILEGNRNIEESPDISDEPFEDSFGHDISGDNFDNRSDEKYEDDDTAGNSDTTGRRQGSSDTYTKFTQNPADLNEFMNLTDQMISSQNQKEVDLENHIESLHTPRTVSLETIPAKEIPAIDDTEPKAHFSDTLQDLKIDLKELIHRARDTIETDVKLTEEIDNVDESREVSDMEHITVYGLKLYDQQSSKKVTISDDDSKLKLPAINETNRPEPKKVCTKKRVLKIFKSNRKYITLREKNRDDADNRTFIVAEDVRESDDQSITTEAPPLKLPRIESARLDDAYDPFVSAARQMKELLSSDTNIPKKMHNSSKDLSRTLPILRPAKDKAPLSQLRSENSKMIKDTINKTYQKTPTLQRMKSFGSSTNDNNNTSTFGGRCSSFRLNRNDKKPSPKLNTTFTKSSKENISIADKTTFNRNNSLNRSFSSYTTSSYSTPKPKDKIPKIATSMYHSFQRTTIKQPVKLDKIKTDQDVKKDFVNLDAILADDNSSMTDSNYIDPRLINENDNLPINVNTILNNPDIISSMESLLTTENLPSKFDSFSKTHNNYELNGNIELHIKAENDKVNTNNNTDTNKLIVDPADNLSAQYDKIMSSLEESIASKTLARDEESVFEEFDLEEFMTSFDEEIQKRKSENQRTCSSTTRVVRQSELIGSNRASAFSSVSSTPKTINPNSNGLTPVTNPKSFNFSSNNIVSESIFPSSIKRSNSILDSIQKNIPKMESAKTRNKSDRIEQDIMRSLKEFDKFYETEKNEINQSNKDIIDYTMQLNGTSKKPSRSKTQRNRGKPESSNGNYTPNGKSSNDSAYSSLNRISPSKLTVCPKEAKERSSLERIPAGSDSSGSQKDEIRSMSSEEFLAMERSAELDEPISPPERQTPHKEVNSHLHEKHASSRASSRRSSTWRPRADLSSSSSEVSLHKQAAPRMSRFCHECGSKFPDAAKFCIECGVKRLAV